MTIDLSGVTLKDGNYVVDHLNFGDKAEGPARTAARGELTITKLRSIYALITSVNAQIDNEADFEKHRSDLKYIKVKMAYESGRGKNSVKRFVEDSHLMTLLDSVESYEQFLLYCRYAESLVAYFKFYGGKDN